MTRQVHPSHIWSKEHEAGGPIGHSGKSWYSCKVCVRCKVEIVEVKAEEPCRKIKETVDG